MIGRASAPPGSPPDDDTARLEAWLASVEAAARAEALQRDLDAMRESRSWKLTAPLRAAMRLASGFPGATPVAARPALRAPVAEHRGTGCAMPFPPAVAPLMARINGDADARRLLVDVTALELEDLGGGIQRVTRRILGALFAEPNGPFVAVPVCLRSDGRYHRANRFTERFLGMAAGSLGTEDLPGARSGDVLLALDLGREFAAVLGPEWAAMRSAGVAVLPVVYDVLPVERPEWFPSRVPRDMRAWLEVVSTTASLALCISDATRDAFTRVLAGWGLRIPDTVVIPMGADDLDAVIPRFPQDRRGRRVLMVGTVEPRKGHADVLDACEALWAEGIDLQLVIAGRPGWSVGPLLERIGSHADSPDRLAWFDRADDATLQGLYLASPVLLAASEGEGFGLPIIEAAHAGCSLLLRDLPVFREVAGDAAKYFNGRAELEAALRGVATGTCPPVAEAHQLPRWRDTAKAIGGFADKMPGHTAAGPDA